MPSARQPKLPYLKTSRPSLTSNIVWTPTSDTAKTLYYLVSTTKLVRISPKL
jgi:hypothetical protein